MPNKYVKIGELLAASRRNQNKTLKAAAETTKIMATYLEAIESGDPGQLPSEPYFLLFARSYAQYLGIDPAVLDEIDPGSFPESLESDISTGEAVESEIEGTETGKQSKSVIRTLAYLIGGAVVLFAALLVYDRLIVGENGELSINESGSAFTAEADESSTVDTSGLPEFNYTPYEPPEKLDLHLLARQEVWVVVAKDGDTVMNRQLTAGEERQWQANYRFMLTVGISTAIELTLNGVKLAPLSDRAQTISGLEINQVNYRRFYPAEENTEMITPTQVIPERPDFKTSVTTNADSTVEETGDGN